MMALAQASSRSCSRDCAVLAHQDEFKAMVALCLVRREQQSQDDRELGVPHRSPGGKDRVEACAVDVQLPVGAL
jgi:hypothetical protein